MLVSLDDDACPERFEVDVCVIGAGAAGISIARELSGTAWRVLLVESGGFEHDPATQALYEGSSWPEREYSPSTTRLRAFGGSTGHWNGWCAPMPEETFARRPWVPRSGWPIARSDLERHYRRAHAILDLGEFDYGARRGAGPPSAALFADGRGALRAVTFRLSPPTRMGVKYRADLASSPNVTVLTRANLLPIAGADGAGPIAEVTAASLAGRRATVRARQYVLACGGLENARLLLASGTPGGAGLANSSGLVGRCFMEHWWAPRRAEVLTRGDWWERLAPGQSGGAGVVPMYELSPAAQAAMGLLECNVRLDVPGAQREAGSPWARLKLSLCGEQAPDPRSRVTIGADVDALGVPKVRVEWSLGEPERRTAREATELFARSLGEAGLGRLKLLGSPNDDPWPANVWGASHHMGTTRMSDDPSGGVVDAACWSHDVPNLSIAGSSVFPTGSHVNPTLTIVALALRHAETLKERLGGAG